MKMKFVFGLALALVLVQCTNPSGGQNGGTENNLLPPEEYQAKIETTKNPIIVDVRTPQEFQSGHLEDAKNINYYDDDFLQQIAVLPKSDTLFVYCKSGGRSGSAASKLRDMGYTVYDLKGGMLKWNASRLPTSTEQANPSISEGKGMSLAAFDSLTASNDLVFVDFYAPWCAPCLKMSPHLEALKKEYGKQIHIVKIDIEKHQAVEKHLGIESIPLLVMYKNGKQAKSILGYQSKEELEALFKSFL